MREIPLNLEYIDEDEEVARLMDVSGDLLMLSWITRGLTMEQMKVEAEEQERIFRGWIRNRRQRAA